MVNDWQNSHFVQSRHVCLPACLPLGGENNLHYPSRTEIIWDDDRIGGIILNISCPVFKLFSLLHVEGHLTLLISSSRQ